MNPRALLFIVLLTSHYFIANCQEENPNLLLDTTLAKKFRLDFAIPDHPAFNILDDNPDEILRPSGSEIFSMIYSNFITGRVPVIPKDFAMEFSPGQLIKANTLQYGDFRVNSVRTKRSGETTSFYPNINPKEILYGTRISIGTKINDDVDSLQNLGIGLRIPLINKGDYRADTVYQNKIIQKLEFYLQQANSFDRKVEKTIFTYLKQSDEIDAGQLAVFNSIKEQIEGIKNQYAAYEHRMNPLRVQIAVKAESIDSLELINKSLLAQIDSITDRAQTTQLADARRANLKAVEKLKLERAALDSTFSDINDEAQQWNYSYERLLDVEPDNFGSDYEEIDALISTTATAFAGSIIEYFESFYETYSTEIKPTRSLIAPEDSIYLYMAQLIFHEIETNVGDNIEPYVNNYNKVLNEHYGNLIDEEIESLKQEYKAEHWNAVKWDLAGAIKLTSADSLVKNLHYAKTSLWSTFASPVSKNAQLLWGMQYSNEKFDSLIITSRDTVISDSTITINDTLPDPDKYSISKFSTGFRIYGGVNRIKAFLEFNAGGQINYSAKLGLNGGLEWNITDGIWLLINTTLDWQKFKKNDVWDDDWQATTAWKVDFRFNLPEKFKLF